VQGTAAAATGTSGRTLLTHVNFHLAVNDADNFGSLDPRSNGVNGKLLQSIVWAEPFWSSLPALFAARGKQADEVVRPSLSAFTCIRCWLWKISSQQFKAETVTPAESSQASQRHPVLSDIELLRERSRSSYSGPDC
jgi:hypothetical protein